MDKFYHWYNLVIIFPKFTLVYGNIIWKVVVTAGLQITNRQVRVKLSGQTCVCTDMACFWPVRLKQS